MKTAREFLKDNIENSNIPEEHYEMEIAELMEMYADHYHRENLKLCEVSRSLPTHKEILSKMDYLVEKHYSKNTEIEKANFRIGWQECFSWLAQTPSDNG